MKIGIFDSGIGGLSVLHQAAKMLPEAEFVYYADERHVPYGEKTRQEVKGYVKEAIDFLIGQGVDAVVIACNTATSVAEKEFRNTFPVPIVGMEPAVKQAIDQNPNSEKRILVIATPITIEGKKLKKLIEKVDKKHRVDRLALPMLVRFAERCNFENKEIDEYLKEQLEPFDLEQYESVVLGCTHFNYFKDHLRRLFPNKLRFVDGNKGTIRRLMRILPKKAGRDVPQVSYFYSGRPINDYEKTHIDRYLDQLDKTFLI